jgi:hypothetical protein
MPVALPHPNAIRHDSQHLSGGYSRPADIDLPFTCVREIGNRRTDILPGTGIFAKLILRLIGDLQIYEHTYNTLLDYDHGIHIAMAVA